MSIKSGEYPVEFPCPICSSRERATINAWKAAKGKEPILPLAMKKDNIVLGNPATDLIVSVLILLTDVCADCGQPYVFRHELQKIMKSVENKKIPGDFRRSN